MKEKYAARPRRRDRETRSLSREPHIRRGLALRPGPGGVTPRPARPRMEFRHRRCPA
jgi:hypothetical protein